MSLCRNADLACEVTLQPLRRYALCMRLFYLDILTIPDAMGLGGVLVQVKARNLLIQLKTKVRSKIYRFLTLKANFNM